MVTFSCRREWTTLGILALLTLGACGHASAPPLTNYVPEEDLARRALVAVLEGWLEDRSVDKLDGGAAILLVDSRRRAGDKLAAYRIVGPQPWDRGRRFVVELTLQGETTSQKTRYVVVGIDPLMVFRQDDFDMLANWMHPMEPTPVGPPPKTPPPTEPTTSGKESP